MAQITGKGKAWELRNSIWMLWAILTFGALSYISFFYASYIVKQRKWFIAGIIYSILFIMLMVVPENSELYDFIMFVYFIGWIVSIIHVFRIRAEYLLRLEAKQASGKQEIEVLKKKIAQEYGTMSKKTEGPVDKTNSTAEPRKIQETLEEELEDNYLEVHLVDVNKATEEEIAGVPGIGGILAKKVVSVRAEVEGFKSFDHFVEVLSFKPHLVEKIKPYLAFSDTPASKKRKKTEGRIVDF